MLVNNHKGFTLVELVIGIIVFSIALTLFTSLLVPQARRSVDPIFQVRASALGQSLMNEIASKSFDENSGRIGGGIRCNEMGNNGVIQACTISSNLGPEEASRDLYDDVDDYNGLVVTDEAIKNALNEDITLDNKALYIGYSVAVTVIYDDNMNGISDAIESGAAYTGNAKLITVSISTPNNENIIFSSYRSNY